ncbi:MAG: helix-turn-helix domain-containing protein [Bosea sp. (in: a-proteobacteria)]
MLAVADDLRELYVPTAADALVAREATIKLKPLEKQLGDVRVQLMDMQDSMPIPLPASAVRFFMEILHNMAEGRAFTLMPMHAELTTQQAADFLNVSRPHVVKLLEGDDIPYRKVGTHRRIRFADLDAYKRKSDVERRKMLDDMVKLTQELGLE